MATGNAIQAATGAGTGVVTSVAAADTSIVVAGTTAAPTLATGTLDVIAADHPPAANWSNNSHKITSLALGSAATDAMTLGQGGILTPVTDAFFPTGVAGGTVENFPRLIGAANSSILASGHLSLVACPVYPGLVISNLTAYSGTTPLSGGVNQWAALYALSNLALLATTADKTSTAWSANSPNTFSFSGGSGAYTVPAGIYGLYVGLMINATVPSLLAFSIGNTVLSQLAPQLTMQSSQSGLTNPASAPNPVTAAAGNSAFYVVLS